MFFYQPNKSYFFGLFDPSVKWGLGKVRFVIGRGEPGLRRGGSLVNFLQIGEGQTCFILKRGRVTVFLARKELLHVASILYIQAKLPVKINLNYLQVSKPPELPTGAFFQSRNSGESVPCRDKWSKFGRILFENSVYSPFGFGNHPRSSPFHFSGLALSLVPAADVPPTESEE